VQPFFDGRRFEGAALPPEEYRGEGAWVVSYPVKEQSMVSSNDILFRQGSTQFADGHSYDMMLALSDALDDPSLAVARFEQCQRVPHITGGNAAEMGGERIDAQGFLRREQRGFHSAFKCARFLAHAAAAPSFDRRIRKGAKAPS
jgi:hypothetical protein